MVQAKKRSLEEINKAIAENREDYSTELSDSEHEFESVERAMADFHKWKKDSLRRRKALDVALSKLDREKAKAEATEGKVK